MDGNMLVYIIQGYCALAAGLFLARSAMNYARQPQYAYLKNENVEQHDL